MQFVAVADIGKFVVTIYADPKQFGGKTLEIASDTVSGRELGAMFMKAAGYPIAYARFSDEVLAGNPFHAKLTQLLDEGRLSGKADLEALRKINPDLQSFRSWLAGDGQ